LTENHEKSGQKPPGQVLVLYIFYYICPIQDRLTFKNICIIFLKGQTYK